MVNSGSDIYDGCTLEIVVSIQPAAEENVEIRPHSLSIHSYKTPTFCDFCGEMLFGMFKQVQLHLWENCQARLLLFLAQKLQIQLSKTQFGKKEQSWCYNPNAPTTTHPQLFKAAGMMIFTLFQLTIQMKDNSMIFWMTFQPIFKMAFQWL